MNSGEIQSLLQKANNLGTVLYLAAHPDDENTSLIAYLANEKNVRTGYLSLNRGDGGQNLIGSEKGKALGVLRTHELLGARSEDKGLQFFTRANDFGFSKTTEETLSMWGKQKVLSDVVWVIRKVKPDVIITRFPASGYEGAHGHHTASAELARKAFKAAGKKDRFAEQLDKVNPWQPKRLLFNTSTYFYRGKEESIDSNAMITVNIGKFNPLLGHSYTELGALSSSHHKSQGFGEAPDRGGKLIFLDHTMGDKANRGILDGINTNWSRLKNGGKVGKHLNKALKNYKPSTPEKIIPHLLKAFKALDRLKNDHWRSIKKHQIKKLILAANGCWFDARAERDYGVPGSQVEVEAKFLKRNNYDLTVEQVEFPFGKTLNVNQSIKSLQPFEAKQKITIPKRTHFTHPYWLRKPMISEGMYRVDQQSLIGLPKTPTPMKVTYTISIEDVTLEISKPVRYRWEDRVEGERYKPFEIGPPVTLSLSSNVRLFPNKLPRKVSLTVKAHKKQVEGEVGLNLPKGWQAEPKSHSVNIEEKEAVEKLRFKVIPPEKSSEGNLKAYFKNENGRTGREMITINYDHIPTQTLFPKANMKLIRENIDKKGKEIGYIMGTGDDVPKALRQMSYDITMINEDNFEALDLSQFDAIVIGVRAYNTQKWLTYKHDALMDYVKNGGNLVTQYNKSRNLLTEAIGPYPFKISDKRVTVEKAPVKLLKPEHPLLNKPNDITQKDFEGWVQERGLYFPGKWNEKYTPLLSSRDPGEDPLKGGLLFTEHGDGAFIYTGYAFFRQLPAGIPGAYKLFSNMVSYGH